MVLCWTSSGRDMIEMVGACYPGARTINEDHCELLPEQGLALLADGAGGLCTGILAARLAVAAIAQLLHRSDGADGPLRAAFQQANLLVAETARLERLPDGALAAAVRGRFDAQAHEILEGARLGHLTLTGMFATVLVCVARGPLLTLAHLGDVRAYRVRGDGICALTRDHTADRELGPEAAALTGLPPDRLARLVTRAVGQPRPLQPDEPEILHDTPQAGDRYLLCTDGLHRSLGPREIRDVLLGAGPDLAGALPALAAQALSAGGDDNIGLVLLRHG